MRITRIYHPEKLIEKIEVSLSSSAAKHVREVLRLSEGDSLILFDGENSEAEAKITLCNRREIKAEIIKVIFCSRESPLKIHVGQGMVRNEKMELILQKLVELGVTSFTPLETEYSNVKLKKILRPCRLDPVQGLYGMTATTRDNRWKNIIISACEQSGRNQLLQLNSLMTFQAWCEETLAEEKWIFDPSGNIAFPSLSTKPKSIALLVGPEGGFSRFEVECAQANGFKTASLGPRILRAETAAMVAATLAESYLGDLRHL